MRLRDLAVGIGTVPWYVADGLRHCVNEAAAVMVELDNLHESCASTEQYDRAIAFATQLENRLGMRRSRALRAARDQVLRGEL